MRNVPQQLLLGQLGGVSAGGEARSLIAQRAVLALQRAGAPAQRRRARRLLLRRGQRLLSVICQHLTAKNFINTSASNQWNNPSTNSDGLCKINEVRLLRTIVLYPINGTIQALRWTDTKKLRALPAPLIVNVDLHKDQEIFEEEEKGFLPPRAFIFLPTVCCDFSVDICCVKWRIMDNSHSGAPLPICQLELFVSS